MPLDSTEYEQLVSEIVARLGIEEHEWCWGPRNHWEGISGYKHQIDVSLSLHDRIELIECKCWSTTVSVPQILTFLARVHDIQQMHPDVQVVRDTVITNAGFDLGVKTLADHYKIVVRIVYDYGRGFDWGPLSTILMGRLGE